MTMFANYTGDNAVRCKNCRIQTDTGMAGSIQIHWLYMYIRFVHVTFVVAVQQRDVKLQHDGHLSMPCSWPESSGSLQVTSNFTAA